MSSESHMVVDEDEVHLKASDFIAERGTKAYRVAFVLIDEQCLYGKIPKIHAQTQT